MPTKHRQQMIDQGLAAPHHGHAPRAVRKAAKAAAEDQALREKAVAAAKAAAENAERVLQDRREEHAARHERELNAAAAPANRRRDRARELRRAHRTKPADKALRDSALFEAREAATKKREAREARLRREQPTVAPVAQHDPEWESRKQHRAQPRQAWLDAAGIPAAPNSALSATLAEADQALRDADAAEREAAAENAAKVLDQRRTARADRQEREQELRRQRRKKVRPA